MIKIQKKNFSIDKEIAKLKSKYKNTGALTNFIGYVRNKNSITELERQADLMIKAGIAKDMNEAINMLLEKRHYSKKEIEPPIAEPFYPNDPKWENLEPIREPFNPNDMPLSTNNGNAENTSDNDWDVNSNGLKLRASGSGENASGGEYILMAFGQPIISNSGIPATAR